MFEPPNYSEYSLKELREARNNIDEVTYPERAETIEEYINQKENERLKGKVNQNPVSSSPKTMSLATKVSIVFGVVITLSGVIYGFVSLFMQGKTLSDPYVKLAKENGISCSFYAVRQSTTEGESMVQVACEATDVLINKVKETAFENQEDFKELVNQYIVVPNLAATPKDDMRLVVITLIDLKTVLCTTTHRGKIINSQFDSYDNYCSV